MENKPGVKTSEFWVVVLSQVLTLFKMFFPEAEIDPLGDASKIMTGLAAIYVLSRTIYKVFYAKYVGKNIVEGQAKAAVAGAVATNLAAGSKAFKFILVATLAVSLIACGPKKQIVDEGVLYTALSGVSAGYGFAHEAITKIASMAAQQIKLSCPNDPNGILCKAAQAFKKVYDSELQPASEEATELWNDAISAFDAYRQLNDPTESDANGVLEKISKLQKMIDKLKVIFARFNFSAGPISFDAVRELERVEFQLKHMQIEVRQRL